MATLIGVVKQAVGEVFAVASNGSRRPLSEGDQVFSGEKLVTGAAGATTIALANGQALTLGRNSELNLDETLLAKAPKITEEVAEDSSAASQPAPVASSAGDQQDADDLLAAIEAGVDPTLEGEATAAGPGSGGGAGSGPGGGHSFVLLDATGQAVDPDVGYPTGPIVGGPLFLTPEAAIGDDPLPEELPDSIPGVEVNYRPSAEAGPGEVDEAALSNAGNPGENNAGSNPDSPAENAFGNLVINSPDGVSRIEVQGADGVWINVQGGGTVVGAYGTLVFDADSNWVYTLNGNTLDHAAGNVGESFPVRAYDNDGDVSPTVSIDTVVLDDVPTVAAVNGEFDALVVDETGESLGQTATGNFSGAFATTFGADGGTVAYSFDIVSLDSGLVDVASGDPVELHLVGGVLQGWVNGDSSVVAFTASVNGSGDVSLTQLRALQHSDPSNDNESVTVAGGFVTLVATVTDGDGDVASAQLDMGGLLVFQDDGPSVSAGEVNDSDITLTTQDAQTIGSDVSDSAGASFAAVMLAAVTPTYGADGAGTTALSGYTLTIENAASGLTSDGQPVTLTMDGNDVVGSTDAGDVFRISVDATGNVTLTQYAELDHLPESIDTVNDNANIALPNGLVSLSATATVTDGDNDQATTTVSLDLGGNLSFDDDLPSVSAGEINDSDIMLTTQDAQTIGDASNSASASFAEAMLTVTPSYGADGAGTTVLSGYTLTLTPGATGLTSNGVAITLAKVGNDVVGSAGANEVFRISVDASGNVTLTQYAELDHLPEDADGVNDNANIALPNGLVSLGATATVTDGDNDQVTTTVSLDLGGNLSFDDDLPSVSAGEINDSAITLTTQDAQTIAAAFDSASASFAAVMLASVTPTYGADGAGTTALSGYTLTLTLGATGLTSNGVAITLAKVGNDVVGSAGANEVFRISVDETGNVTLTQYAELDHLPEDADGVNDNANIALPNGLVSLSATATVTDGDNDQVTTNVSLDLGGNLSFDDDLPSVSAGVVNDSAITLTTQDAQTIAAAFDSASASFAAVMLASVTPTYGADGAGTTALSGYTLTVNQAASGLTSNGVAITLAKVGNDVVGSAGANEVFRISVDASGNVTLTQYAELDHLPEDADGVNDNANIALPNGLVSLSATATVTDGDNDQVTTNVSLDLGGNLSFDDALPSVSAGVVNDSAITLTTQDAQTIGAAFDTDSDSFAAVMLAAVTPTYGADGAGTTVLSGYTLTLTPGATGLTSNGVGITLAKVGNDVVGSAGANEVFRISVDATGNVTLTQYAELDHLPEDADGVNDNANIALPNGLVSLSATATVTDGDNDQATTNVSLDLGGNLSFDDDLPTVTVTLNGTTALVLDESIGASPNDSNAASDDDVSGNPFPADYGTAIGLVSTILISTTVNSGADGADAGSTVISLNVVGFSGTGVDSGLNSGGQDVLLYKETNGDVTGRVGGAAGTVVFSMKIATDGTVSVAQYKAIDHPVGGSSYDESVSINAGLLQAVATTTDGDNDVATSSADIGGRISFQDDGPSIAPQSIVMANQVGNDATASLNLDGGEDGAINGSVIISGATNNLGQALDSNGDVLYSGSSPLYYYTNGGTLYATTTQGSTAGAVFTVDPDPVTGTYTVTLLGALNAPTTTFTSNFGSTDAGGPADPYTSFFIAADGTTQKVQIFGFGSTVANTSSDGLGIDNNLVNGPEQVGVYFGTDVGKAIVTVGNFAGDKFGWKAIDITNASALLIAALPDTDPASTSAWTLQEFYDSITIVGTDIKAKFSSAGVAQDIGDVVDSGTITAPGTLGQSDSYTVTLDPSASFDFLYITSATGSGTNSFKIEQLSFEGSTVSSPVDVGFTAVATDADTDVATSTAFNVTFAGNTDGSYTLLGTSGDEVIQGGAANEGLSGLLGDDVLIGGLGNDQLTGGTGDDTFVWKSGDTGSDVVTDFKHIVGGEQDVLDISDLLAGIGLQPLVGSSTDIANILNPVLTISTGANSVITVETGAVDQSFQLTGVNLYTTYGGGSEFDVIKGMLDDGALKVV